MPLDLNYHHLYYFWVCVRAGSLTAASRELHLSQSALSLQLKSLETSLGRRLLERSRTGVVMTPDGRVVFERCERIFPEGESLSAALHSSAASPASPVRLGVTSALGRGVVFEMLARISRVKGASPAVFVCPREDVKERLARRRLDVAVVGTDLARELGTGFRSRRIDALPMVFVAAPALARRLPDFPRRGAEIPVLLRTSEHPMRARVERWLFEKGARPVVAAETDDVDLLRELALRGNGVATLPATAVAEELASRRLTRLGAVPRGLIHEVWAVAPARESVDPAVREAVGRIFAGGPLEARGGAHGRV